MKLEYNILAIEVTRRCNQKCEGYCMRGEKQNLDIDLFYIDKLLENDFKGVHELIFSGGEPTLNPHAIAYTIDKIIQKNLPFFHISLVTNGLEYSQEIVDAFEKFNQHTKNFPHSASISFSVDKYHKPIDPNILNLYNTNSKTIDFDTKDSSILLLKSGFCKTGREVDYNNNFIIEDLVVNAVYLTAKGNICFFGEGSFDMLDTYSIGNSIAKKSLNDICLEHLPREKKLLHHR